MKIQMISTTDDARGNPVKAEVVLKEGKKSTTKHLRKVGKKWMGVQGYKKNVFGETVPILREFSLSR